jgi:hypothetical protein
MLIMAGPSKKHHYIPRFYQRGFISDNTNRIWVYEKDREPRRYSVRKTGMEIALYGFTNKEDKFDTHTVEKELANIDNDAARIIKKLEGGFPLDDDERRRLCKFVSIMLRRTPKHKEVAEKMAGEMIPRFFEEHDEKWLYEEIKKRAKSGSDVEHIFEQQGIEFQKLREQYTSQVPDFLFARNTLRESVFERVMYVMDWAFFKATPETEFLTCDNPVAFSKGSGLKDREAVIMFPLSRQLFLQAMWISAYRNTYQRLRAYL